MKDFKDFEKYMRTDGSHFHDDIVKEVNAKVERANTQDPIEEHEFYRRAWVEIGFMKMLEHYHNWLNS